MGRLLASRAMECVCVLFEQPIRGEVAGQVLRELGLDRGFDASDGTLEVTVGGFRIKVGIHGVPVAAELLADALAHTSWEAAAATVGRHAAHARIETEEPVDGEPLLGPGLRRLRAVSRLAAALLTLPGALALFDPAGRALTDAAHASARLRALDAPVPPLDLWITVRHFQIADASGWFIDTLGMEQLGLPDLESYAADGPGTTAVVDWLRNLGLYLVQQGAPIRSGDTLDGPDEQPWVAREDDATVEPARRVLRFSPVG
ncbi:MAG: DUF4261 domain-containing protein [Myxococcales bacterium]|nr:DUF4261 domain-containing protein [Myxococcales bacterium]